MTRKKRRTARRDSIRERQARLARELLTNPSQRGLAEALGVSKSTVNRDVAELRAGWQREARAAIGEHVTTQLARLEMLFAAAVEQMDKTPYAIYAALRALELEAKLLGLNAGERVVDPWAGEELAELPAGFDPHAAGVAAQEFLEVMHGVRYTLIPDDDDDGRAPRRRQVEPGGPR